MKPSKIIPILLWVVALSLLAAIYYARNFTNTGPLSKTDSALSADGHLAEPAGTVFVDVPWQHLPDVDRFQLKDQNGDPFDSAQLTGKPYLVSFFFASCPSICRDLNNRIFELNQQLRNEDITFVSITVDPKNDTPEVLNRYAKDFNATPDRWAFVTDQMAEIKQLGEQVFRVEIDLAIHTEDILLVDRWGRYRDRFKWDDPYDMKRLITVVKDVAAEQAPPFDKIIHTRNAMAGVKPPELQSVPWVREFFLTQSDGETFYSRDMTGAVWIANFFFTSCPGICKEQTAYLRNLRERLGDSAPTIVSITTDPTNDTPQVLAKYAQKQGANDHWRFCTGDSLLIRRISSEFFHAHSSDSHHTSRLFVVDRWGKVRGNFDWQDPVAEAQMLKLIEACRAEVHPMRPLIESIN